MIKGLALARLVYDRRPELRPSNDVDIVIAPADLRRADHALRASGLVRSWPVEEPPDAARPMLLRMANVFTYRGAALNEMVELHHRPTINPCWMPVTFADAYEAGVDLEWPQGRVRALDGPLNVHYLCQHALYYRDFRLKWFGDLARALRRARVNSCAECVARYPLRLPRQPGLLADAVFQLLKGGIVQALAGNAAPIGSSPEAAFIVRHMTEAVRVPRGRNFSDLPLELWSHGLTMRHIPGLRGKAHQLLLALSDPRDAVRLRLSPRLTAVYWLLGPVLSLVRYVLRRREGATAPSLAPAPGTAGCP